MPAFHASSTRSMGQIWFVVLAFFFVFLFVGWKSVKAIEEIGENTLSMTKQMEEVMNTSH